MPFFSEQQVEGDGCICFFSAMASEARGEKALSQGAEEGVLITGEVSKWHISASVPVVWRFLFVCLPLEGFTVNLHILQQK